MARTRTIKPHFLYSASMEKVSDGAQLAFVRLWLIVDDAGRFETHDNWRFVSERLFPRASEPRPEVAGWLDELERVGCIRRYAVGPGHYLRIVNWRQHQTVYHPAPSKLPGEPAGVGGSPEMLNSGSGASNNGSGTPAEPLPRKSRGAPQFREPWEYLLKS